MWACTDQQSKGGNIIYVSGGISLCELITFVHVFIEIHVIMCDCTTSAIKGHPPEGEVILVILDTGVCPCNVQDHLPCRESYKPTLMKQPYVA